MLTAQVFKGEKRMEWYVRLISANGKTLAVSEAYVTKWNAKRAAKKNFPEATLRIVD